MTQISSPRRLIYPIRLQTDFMERLLVADIKGDPEFTGIEPQTFNDPINGKGMRVIRYRTDGTVDVYWQPGVKMDRATFEIGKGTADFVETQISPSRFEVTDRGIDVDLAFTDLQGRVNEFRVCEDAPGKKSFPLLAPISANIDNPIQFNVVYMPDFDMVYRAGTVVEGRIGDRPIQPDTIPLILRGQRIWLMRYADRPVIGVFNPPMDRPTIVDVSGGGDIDVDGMVLSIDLQGGLTRVAAGLEPGQTRLDFSPAFPNLQGFSAGRSATGQWTLHTAGARITAGTFRAEGQDGSIVVELDVKEKWKPADIPFSIWLLTTVVPVFRTWPPTYRWRGVVTPGESPGMTGKWERVKR